MAHAPKIEYQRYRDFERSLGELWRKGGRFQKAAEAVQGIVGRISLGGDPFHGHAVTNHGESRIPHCVKYDLTGACRLITVQDKKVCVLVYCGDHDACDQWLNSHRGFVPIVGTDGVLTITYMSSEGDAAPEVGGGTSYTKGPLFERIPEALFERLMIDLPRKTVRNIESFESTTSDSEMWLILNSIPDDGRRRVLFDVLSLLRQDKRKEAKHRAELYFGVGTLLEQLPVEQLPEIVDSDVIRRIDPSSPQYSEALKRFMQTAGYREWMLFMHPDQEAVVNEDFDGPAKLVGVSGSGKTCVIVQRAVRLARLYENERVLVLTLNRALAALIRQLVDSCCTSEESRRIVVLPFFEQCRSLLLEFEPQAEKKYDEVTWKINEHVDEIWQEYYRCEVNNTDAGVFLPVHDSLLSRGWKPERYLREEVDWLRSALGPDERVSYLEMQRVGRTLGFTRPFREAVLEGASGWELKMDQIGVIDGLGIVQALIKYREEIVPQYRAVLVDEAQDFGNVELAIVRRLVAPAANDLFICGDAAQAVTTKFQSLKAIGMSIAPQRSRKLTLNYRNSREVLAAAHSILMANLTEEMLDREDFDILDPEYSAFSATTPLILEAGDLEHEIAYALKFAQDLIGERQHAKACIAICGHSLLELSQFGEQVHLPVLDGRTDIQSEQVFLSDLEQTKGFEFDVMIVVNCAGGILPSASCPESERYRDLARLYVAMTRAKTDLVLSWAGSLSPFLLDVRQHFLQSTWAEYLDVMPSVRLGVPSRMEERRESGRARKAWGAMTGAEFLYQDEALGLDSGLIAKLRDLVDGTGLRRSGRRIRWANLATAAADYAVDPFCRREWGPEIGRQFQELTTRLRLLEEG